MKKIFYVFLALFLLVLVSCKDKVMGYSVVLWNVPDAGLQSGDLVPVYIRSNISHVYVIGSKDGTKIEVPIWQISEPLKQKKVQAVHKRYSDYAHHYASVKLDGLPCRAEPVNTAKQVYRLRKGEVIKILYKGKGQAVMAGKKPLEGDWFKILTSNGTSGWCFSYNLNIYETDVNGNAIGAQIVEEEVEEDENLSRILDNIWYPDYFSSMIRSGNIDLTRIHPSYNFNIDTENNKVYLNTNDVHQSWDYKGYTKTGDFEYTLTDIPLVIIYKRANYIVLRYTGESGKPQELNFVTIEENLEELITNEKNRRNEAYLQIWVHGPVFTSSNYGKLTFNEDGTFTWTNFKLLVPSIIQSGAKNYGTAYVKYSISKTLSSTYDGVVSFKFDGVNEEVNFLYRLESNGLRLEDAVTARFDGNQLKERGSSPVILYFKTPVKNTDFTSTKEN